MRLRASVLAVVLLVMPVLPPAAWSQAPALNESAQMFIIEGLIAGGARLVNQGAPTVESRNLTNCLLSHWVELPWFWVECKAAMIEYRKKAQKDLVLAYNLGTFWDGLEQKIPERSTGFWYGRLKVDRDQYQPVILLLTENQAVVFYPDGKVEQPAQDADNQYLKSWGVADGRTLFLLADSYKYQHRCTLRGGDGLMECVASPIVQTAKPEDPESWNWRPLRFSFGRSFIGAGAPGREKEIPVDQVSKYDQEKLALVLEYWVDRPVPGFKLPVMAMIETEGLARAPTGTTYLVDLGQAVLTAQYPLKLFKSFDFKLYPAVGTRKLFEVEYQPAPPLDVTGLYEFSEDGYHSSTLDVRSKADGSLEVHAESATQVNQSVYTCSGYIGSQISPQGVEAARAPEAVFESTEYAEWSDRRATLTIQFLENSLIVKESNVFSSPYCGMNGYISTGEYRKVKPQKPKAKAPKKKTKSSKR